MNEIFSNNKVFQSRGLNGIKYFIPQSLLGLEHSDEQWRAHRNILIGAFTESYLRKYSEEIVSRGNCLVDVLTRDGHVSDINRLMSDVTYEVIYPIYLSVCIFLLILPYAILCSFPSVCHPPSPPPNTHCIALRSLVLPCWVWNGWSISHLLRSQWNYNLPWKSLTSSRTFQKYYGI